MTYLIKTINTSACLKRVRYLNENFSYIESVLKMLKNENIEVVFFTTPTSSSYHNLEQVDYRNLTSQCLLDLSKKYGSVYLDYERLPEFVNNSKYFMDADHMNVLGAEAFSKILFTNSLHH